MEHDPAPTYQIEVNGKVFDVELPQLTGRQIRALAYVDPAHELLLEGADAAEDRLIGEDDIVDLTGERTAIYTRPPTAFGRGDQSSDG